MSKTRYLHFDDMTWPNPTDDIEWRLRYETDLTREDRLFAASVVAAYRQLVSDPRRRREDKIRGIRERLSEKVGDD